MSGTVHQVSVSKGGVPKLPVLEGFVRALGIDGDAVSSPDIHGGPERAVCLFSLEVIEALVAEGHPIAPGATGENITLAGVDWNEVVPGARIAIGDEVILEVTRFTTPCSTIRASFKDRDSNRIHQNLHPGSSRAYAKVLREGMMRPGDAVSVTSATEQLARSGRP